MRQRTVEEVLDVLAMPTVDRVRELLADARFPREVICDDRVSFYAGWKKHFEGLKGSGVDEQLLGALELYNRCADIRDFVIVPRARERVKEVHGILEQSGFHPSHWFMFGSVAAGKFSPTQSDIDIGVVLPAAECDDPRFIEVLRTHRLPGAIPWNRWDMRIEITRYSQEWMIRRLERESSTSEADEWVRSMLRDGGARIPLEPT